MSDTDRLKKLEQQREALNQKIRRERARQAEQERKKDTRRKIVVGAVVLGYAERHPDFQEQLETMLQNSVSDRDKYLFPDLFPAANDAPSTGRLTGKFRTRDNA